MVTIAVFLMIASLVGFTVMFQGNNVSHASLTEIAGTISLKVDDVEAIAGKITVNFYFNGSGTGINLPALVNGNPYSIEFTQNYIILSIKSYFTTTVVSSTFSNEVHLYPMSVISPYSTPEGYVVTHTQITAWDQQYSDLTFTSGTNFAVSRLPFIVDGMLTYLTVVYLQGPAS